MIIVKKQAAICEQCYLPGQLVGGTAVAQETQLDACRPLWSCFHFVIEYEKVAR